ncbi:MAG: 1-(5-phosphoribosyl)-5-[(5-phosphoribosylamino)methylideneamino]imidazole-4-carboxamide isomerase [Candidatus Omnitrophota bacterium]
MIVIPAVDIQDGKVVRLVQGKFKEATIYSHKPEEVARKWESDGAILLHVVDLDGAQSGAIKNWTAIASIVKAVKIRVQIGGGVRSAEDIRRLLELGVGRVVLGTKAVEDREFIRKAVSLWPENILVSIDVSAGRVAQKGWAAVSSQRPEALAKEMQEIGVRQMVFTDIARDGTLAGVNIPRIEKMLEAISAPLIVAGGIASLQDLIKLKALEPKGLKGVIVGKALYEGKLDLKEAIAVC